MTFGDGTDLTAKLLDAARAIGAAVADAHPSLIGPRFNSEVLSDAITGDYLSRQESDLPQQVFATLLDGFPLLIGTLNGPPNGAIIGSQLRRYRNQATICRSWLGTEASNLHMFLIGPPGALIDATWRQFAAEIEADDRVCRKQVWLFDTAPTIGDAREFLERTFVARPWPSEQRTELLDSMANISLPSGWEEALKNQELDFSELVDQLIALEEANFV
ncbi:hypothetical protein CR103_10575 [Massilia psychrophila]|uniref:Uncharacterized protein n=2 Tax=Massilia psychrophila TaxID=1603353 RepID=A0A2G8T1L6_9BURK|nr:hypothetical protein CR103_10575 [Massilia psychrophila]GGE80908.1 hypothetical protein GCM10008020_27200 [Massilia psychrophila]